MSIKFKVGNREIEIPYLDENYTSSTGKDSFHKRALITQEPVIKNRFKISFPEEFQLESFFFQSCSPLVWKDGKWQDIKVDFMEDLTLTMSKGFKKLVERSKNTSFEVVHLDGPGNEVSRWKINGVVAKLCLGGMDYSNDDIIMNHIIISPNHIEIA